MGKASGLESAEGAQLELQGRGTDTHRRVDETDESYRPRLRRPQNAVTRAAILDAVSVLLAPYTSKPPELIEWFEGPFLDHDFLSDRPLGHGWHGFIVVIPELSTPGTGEAFLDVDAYLGSSAFLGIDNDHPVYAPIAATIAALKAAGVQASLVMRGTP